jgi:hypothetical protein
VTLTVESGQPQESSAKLKVKQVVWFRSLCPNVIIDGSLAPYGSLAPSKPAQSKRAYQLYVCSLVRTVNPQACVDGPYAHTTSLPSVGLQKQLMVTTNSTRHNITVNGKSSSVHKAKTASESCTGRVWVDPQRVVCLGGHLKHTERWRKDLLGDQRKPLPREPTVVKAYVRSPMARFEVRRQPRQF